MSNPIQLRETKHPHKTQQQRFDQLIGLDAHKAELLTTLRLILQPDWIEAWQQAHHPKGLPHFGHAFRQSPLVLLSGDVGCGKTELALSIGTPLSKQFGDAKVLTLEVPSDVRGSGMVGELSARITAAFAEAKRLVKGDAYGILVLDEADDLATTREQAQAHHEDRAGVNALIKELDLLEREGGQRLAVLMITNRASSLDPAVLRRASTHLRFERPDESALFDFFMGCRSKMSLNDDDVQALVARCNAQSPRYAYSDLIRRVLRKAIIQAISEQTALKAAHLHAALLTTTPSPSITL